MPYLTQGEEELSLFVEAEARDRVPVCKRRRMSCKEALESREGSKHEHPGNQNGVACLQPLPNGHAKLERRDTGMMEGVESTPPQTTCLSLPVAQERSIVKLRRLPCPARLWPFVPPLNFGTVKDYEIFRSAYPQDDNFEFLQRVGVKTILTLVETPPSDEYVAFVRDRGIVQKKVHIRANKDGEISVTDESVAQALLIMLDASFYPLYIHCNRGKHRTGCVVACLRRVQSWPMEDILAEYDAYASPKARPDDIAFIESFDCASVFDYARAHGYLSDPGRLKRIDSSVGNIDALAEALASVPSGNYNDIAVFQSGSSSASTTGSSTPIADEHVKDEETVADPNLQPTSQLSTGGDVAINGSVCSISGVSEHGKTISATTTVSSLSKPMMKRTTSDACARIFDTPTTIGHSSMSI